MTHARFVLILITVFASAAWFSRSFTLAAQDESDASDSPFQRRDAPAGDTLAQLNFGGGIRGEASPNCVFTPGGAGPAACVLEVAEDGGLAFEGFAPGEPILVEVAKPDGTVETAEALADSQGRGQIPWITLPGGPLGEHQVTATQGALQASGSFTVRAASEPQSVVVPRAAPPGTVFQVALAGFAPNQSVPLRLYRDVGETFWYLADLAPAQVDGRGEALYPLSTRASDPEGRYLIATEPRVAGPGQLNGQFLLTRGGDPTEQNPDAIIPDLALAAVQEANRVWTQVLADGSRPVTDLERAFAGPRLQEASAEVEAMRSAGQTRVARLVAPPVVRSAQELSRFRIDAVVAEQWEDRLVNADGSLAEDRSGARDRRYALELRFEPCYCWFVVESGDAGARP